MSIKNKKMSEEDIDANRYWKWINYLTSRFGQSDYEASKLAHERTDNGQDPPPWKAP